MMKNKHVYVYSHTQLNSLLYLFEKQKVHTSPDDENVLLFSINMPRLVPQQ